MINRTALPHSSTAVSPGVRGGWAHEGRPGPPGPKPGNTGRGDNLNLWVRGPAGPLAGHVSQPLSHPWLCLCKNTDSDRAQPAVSKPAAQSPRAGPGHRPLGARLPRAVRQSARGNLPPGPRAGVLRAPARWVRAPGPLVSRGGAWGTRARPSPPRPRAKRCESPWRRKFAVRAFRVRRVSGTARRRRPTRTVCGEVQLGELRRRLAVRGASARPSAA